LTMLCSADCIMCLCCEHVLSCRAVVTAVCYTSVLHRLSTLIYNVFVVLS